MVVGSVEAQAIMTPPEMVGARLVPASPFGGPSKLVGKERKKSRGGGPRSTEASRRKAIMTPPVMVGARLVPASPFGGPSKRLGIVLALYGGSPLVWMRAVLFLWLLKRRGKTGPNLL